MDDPFTRVRTVHPFSHRRAGFSLTELAIVLAAISLILTAVWEGAQSVKASSQNSAAVTELQIISRNILSTFEGQSLPGGNTGTAPWLNQILINAHVIPTAYVNPSSNGTQIDHPWAQQSVAIWKVGSAYDNQCSASDNCFRISFYNVPMAGCIALLTQGTSCQPNQIGCPIQVLTGAGAGGPQNVTATVTPNGASTLCAANTPTANSVEFDYLLK